MVAITVSLTQSLFKDFTTFWMGSNYTDANDTLENFLRNRCKNFYGRTAMLDHSKPWRMGHKVLFYDQEPLLDSLTPRYIDMFMWPYNLSFEEFRKQAKHYGMEYPGLKWSKLEQDPKSYLGDSNSIVVSEISQKLKTYCTMYKLTPLYYFAHGFIALDWYRYHYAQNVFRKWTKPSKDFISMNRIVIKDRSYRLYWISLLKQLKLCKHGYVSFNTDSENVDWKQELPDRHTHLTAGMIDHIRKNVKVNRISIDKGLVPGYMSAFISDETTKAMHDSTWHIVSETVFWHDKLHLTEKIFKPIVFKQPFMLLGAPGNLKYLKQYGFKTFEGIIDESYDQIADPELRMQAVAQQLAWYCGLSQVKKNKVQQACQPIVEHNFKWFYGMFKHHIINELFENTKSLMKQIKFDQDRVDWHTVKESLLKLC